MNYRPDDVLLIRRAVQLAKRGEGFAEPNPMVGCVITQNGRVIGEGYHQRCGGPHAEVEAINSCDHATSGATLYVSLEPCCHHGRTPPCTDAILAAGIQRVVFAQRDPFPQVNGGGAEILRNAGLEVVEGVLEDEARALNAPYLTRVTKQRPWVLGKWAMTLDGKIATRSGHSQWISNEASRAVVHQLRGRMDAIVVGRNTVQADNPRLTARPPGPRVPLRVVLDRHLKTSLDCQLVQTAADIPTLFACHSATAAPEKISAFKAAGCQIWTSDADNHLDFVAALLTELAQRDFTNVLIEGGGQVLGSFADAGLLDEIHAFVAPRLSGGEEAPAPVGGDGVATMDLARELIAPKVQLLDGDIYVSGRLKET